MIMEEPKGHGIQSLELGLDILKKIAGVGKPLTVTEISSLCGISKSKLHRYLTSFSRSGILQKNADLKYTLGIDLILLGIKASEQFDIQSICHPYLIQLKEDLNETAALAIWGEQGPFFIQWEAGNRAVNLGIKTGSQVSVTESAPGKLFAAYLPKERTQQLIDRELSERGIEMDSLTDELKDIRQKGYCVSTDSLVPGITAVSCPALDINGNIAAALTVVFMTGALDTSATSEFIQLLQQKGSELSRALGYTLK
jgi:DNA-binding IclR family transcriptional regulator